jgi:hypothetical protein
MKLFICSVSFIVSTLFGFGQVFHGHFDNYNLMDYKFELDTVIQEPYAIVRFHYDFSDKNPGEVMQLVVSTPQSCELYKLNPSNEIEVITNRSQIEFRVENQFGVRWIYVPKHNIVQGRINHVFLKRVFLEDNIIPTPTETEIRDVLEKPVIYFYSNGKTSYDIRLPKRLENMFVYPTTVNNTWTITANEIGDIRYNNDVFPYLFWEAEKNIDVSWEKGFTVANDSLLFFLEQKLTLMNLSSREKTDFITYWYPKMSRFKAVDVQFIFNQEYQNQILDIQVSPGKITSFRVFMVFREHVKGKKIEKQEIEIANRAPEFYLEWGGSELK